MRAGAGLPPSHTDVVLDVAAASPPRARGAAAAVGSSPPRAFGAAGVDRNDRSFSFEEEQRRGEVASLRQEVAMLLKMNGQLHAQLQQRDTPEQRFQATGAPALAGQTAVASGHTGAMRRSNEGREFQGDPALRSSHASSLSAAFAPGSQAVEPISGRQSFDSYAGGTHDHEELARRLRSTELARSAAEQRYNTAEWALKRTMEEFSRGRAAAAEHESTNHWADKEVDLLHRELVEAQTGIQDMDRALQRKREQILQNERDQAEVRVEHDALVSANAMLQRDIEGVRARISIEQSRAKCAEAEVHELQAKLHLKENTFGNEVSNIKAGARLVEGESIRSMNAFEASEAAATKDRLFAHRLQADLDALLTSHNELKEKEARTSQTRKSEEGELTVRSEHLVDEQAELSKRLAEVQAATCQLQAEEDEVLARCERLQLTWAQEEARAEEFCRHSRAEAQAAELRAEALAQQLADERRQNLELARELAAARGVAGEVTLPTVGEMTAPEGRTGGWTVDALEAQKEVEELRKWRGSALGAIQRMQSDFASVQGQYHQQLEHNQELQEKLERMGQQARGVLSRLPGVASSSLGAQREEPAELPAAAPPIPHDLPEASGQLSRAPPALASSGVAPGDRPERARGAWSRVATSTSPPRSPRLQQDPVQAWLAGPQSAACSSTSPAPHLAKASFSSPAVGARDGARPAGDGRLHGGSTGGTPQKARGQRAAAAGAARQPSGVAGEELRSQAVADRAPDLGSGALSTSVAALLAEARAELDRTAEVSRRGERLVEALPAMLPDQVQKERVVPETSPSAVPAAGGSSWPAGPDVPERAERRRMPRAAELYPKDDRGALPPSSPASPSKEGAPGQLLGGWGASIAARAAEAVMSPSKDASGAVGAAVPASPKPAGQPAIGALAAGRGFTHSPPYSPEPAASEHIFGGDSPPRCGDFPSAMGRSASAKRGARATSCSPPPPGSQRRSGRKGLVAVGSAPQLHPTSASASRGAQPSPATGPVGGPFYEAYLAREREVLTPTPQQAVSARLASRSSGPAGRTRRRRGASASRAAPTTMVVRGNGSPALRARGHWQL